MAALTPIKQRFWDNDNNLLAGGKVYVYLAGTTTPTTSYTDSTGATPNTNPVILDAKGEAQIWTDRLVKIDVFTSADVQVTGYPVDYVGHTSDSEMIVFTQAGTGAITRSVQAKERDIVSSKDYATGDGVTDDAAALRALNTAALGQIIFTKGTYVVNSNITFTQKCIFENGAVLNIATGVTVAFNAGLEAGIYRIFSLTGTGLVTISPTYTKTGYPEWWGGFSGGAVDAGPGILASFVACSETILQAADYYISNTLKLETPGHALRGAGCLYNSVAGDSTRIIVTGGSSDCVQLGPDTQPASINLFPQGMAISGFEVSRSAAPVISSNCRGILSQYNLYCTMDDIKSVESMRAFEYIGTVALHTRHCWAFRSSAGTGAGTDYWYGYYINGTVTIPASGGNASFYISYCNANNTLATFATKGYYIDDKWADTYVIHPEITGCTHGISVIGNGSATLGYGETDLQIIKPIIDDFSTVGIVISATSIYGSITIQGGFLAPRSSSTPTAGVYFTTSKAPTSISGLQYVLGPATGITAGLLIENSQNVTSIGNTYLECGSVPVYLSTANNNTIIDRVTNNTNTCSAVLYSVTSDRNKLEMTYSGATDKATLGYSFVSTGNDYNEINCTGLDPTGINGGSANKLVINSVQITATGLSGNNLVSGVMA